MRRLAERLRQLPERGRGPGPRDFSGCLAGPEPGGVSRAFLLRLLLAGGLIGALALTVRIASRDLLNRQRRSDAEAIVDRYAWIGAGVLMATPLPGLDLLGAAAVNAQMVVEIGRVYGVTLSRVSAQELAVSVGRTLAGLGLIKGGVAMLGAALSLNLPALVVSRAIQAVSGAWLTRLAGRSFITYFQQDQDWGDGGLAEVLQREYELNRREGALRSFLAAAFNRVVEPLQSRPELRLPPRPGPRPSRSGEPPRGPREVEAEADRADPEA